MCWVVHAAIIDRLSVYLYSSRFHTKVLAIYLWLAMYMNEFSLTVV